MTQEEAIKVAYGIPVTKVQHEALQFLIPELRESEDEKIRKGLLAAFQKMNGWWNGMLVSGILAWLEKQKEQKHPNGCFTCDEYKKGYEEGRRNGFTAGYNKAMKEVEQKEDKDELVYRLNGLMQDYIKEGKDDEEKEHRLKCYQLFWDALEDTNFFEQKEQKQTDLPAGFYYIDLNGNRYYSKEFHYGDMKLKVGEQKPVLTAKEAWKEMRLEVYAQASGNRHEPNYSDDSTKMFSLCDIDEIFEKIGNSTVEQKPAEWSEEDKEMLECVIMDVEKAKENYLKSTTQVVQQGAIIADKELTWLKSLRPPFKPSEEQMEALKEVMETYKGFEEYNAMKSLYEQLKKL